MTMPVWCCYCPSDDTRRVWLSFPTASAWQGGAALRRWAVALSRCRNVWHSGFSSWRRSFLAKTRRRRSLVTVGTVRLGARGDTANRLFIDYCLLLPGLFVRPDKQKIAFCRIEHDSEWSRTPPTRQGGGREGREVPPYPTTTPPPCKQKPDCEPLLWRSLTTTITTSSN